MKFNLIVLSRRQLSSVDDDTLNLIRHNPYRVLLYVYLFSFTAIAQVQQHWSFCFPYSPVTLDFPVLCSSVYAIVRASCCSVSNLPTYLSPDYRALLLRYLPAHNCLRFRPSWTIIGRVPVVRCFSCETTRTLFRCSSVLPIAASHDDRGWRYRKPTTRR